MSPRFVVSALTATSLLLASLLVGAAQTRQRVPPTAEEREVGAAASKTIRVGLMRLYYLDLPMWIPKTLGDLSDKSELIVEARVQTVLPSTKIKGSEDPYTDAVLVVLRELKGTAPGAEVLVSQLGGQVGTDRLLPANFNLMEERGKYLLFLNPMSQEESERRPERGTPRHEIVGVYMGALQLDDNDRFQLPKSMSAEFRNNYDRLPLDRAVAEILSHLVTTEK